MTGVQIRAVALNLVNEEEELTGVGEIDSEVFFRMCADLVSSPSAE